MKKTTSLVLLLLWICFLAGCENTVPNSSDENQEPENITQKSESSDSLLWEHTVSMHYAKEMKKPDFDDMINKEEVQNANYENTWEKEYALTQEDVDGLKDMLDNNYCSEWIWLWWFGNYWNEWMEKVTINKEDLKVWKTFKVSWRYHWFNWHPLKGNIINQLKEHGFWIQDFSEWSRTAYNSDFWTFYMEEWVNRTENIWGSSHNEYERYPFNTLLVTNDLLLHVFHKIFSNELQYFEESEARPLLTNLTEGMYTIFKQGKLWNNKELNEFLTAYWTIPYALLPSNDELISELQERERHMRDNFSYDWNNSPTAEFSDEELQEYLTKRFEKLLPSVAKQYQDALKEEWKQILAAEASTGPDPLLLSFSPEYIEQNGIKQDFTQFRPRAHYTNSSFLKTYFMASKWLMREKLYIWDKKLAKAAIYLASATSLKEGMYDEMHAFQEKIRNLIWSDDDIGVEELVLLNQLYLSWDVNNMTDEIHKIIMDATTKQRISSSSYRTSEMLSKTEDEAKDMLNGFVFLWEKFTIDSYLFDLLTAGNAEKEFLKKPNIQTALLVPDVIENYAPANQLVQLWLKEKSDKKDDEGVGLVLEDVDCWEEKCMQVSRYNEVKAEARDIVKKVLEEDQGLLDTFYHKWLKTIGQLFAPVENLPYFKKDPLYIFKNLATYMGSYTELKHDTLLYTKQAYAELGGGWDDGCTITVYPPELPVPKGYIEADVNFISELIRLNTSISAWFENKDNFNAFNTYLKHINAIAQKQMKNEKIDDSEFEWLRLSREDLNEITYPRKLFWEPTQKLERGALIADIFTSSTPEGSNPLYEAVWRPLLMALMVDDVNGKRIVMWPIFSHYEFYQTDSVLDWDKRYTDEDWQQKYDSLTNEERINNYGIETRNLFEWLDK